jgi:hypothetical protein
MTNITVLAEYRVAASGALVALRRLAEWTATVAAITAEHAELGASIEAAKRAAHTATATMGPCPWTDALYRRLDTLKAGGLLRAKAGREARWHRADAKRTAGAVLARLDKRAARALYSQTFPALSRQKVEWEVSMMIGAHRATCRAQQGIA